MSKSKVYFIKNTGSDYERLGNEALKLLKKIKEESEFEFERIIPIKVHFGEKGNKTFIPPAAYNGIIEYLKSENAEPFYIETNVLYRGSRTTKEDHIKTAKSHGFNQIPIIIADGEIGLEYDEIEINKKYFNSCKIGGEYSDYNQFIVSSHFKGHIAAGFGGAIKQLAMGFAARAGKMEQHTDISPMVSADKCISCGICLEKCDFNAIEITDAAEIIGSKCTGCAGCIAVCPEGAISNSWSGSNFYQKIAEYAYGASKNKDIIYISFVHNITEECDCVGASMEPIIDNVGVLASRDPVALDTACLELVQQQSGEKIFEKGRTTLKYGEEIGLGTMNYEISEIYYDH